METYDLIETFIKEMDKFRADNANINFEIKDQNYTYKVKVEIERIENDNF